MHWYLLSAGVSFRSGAHGRELVRFRVVFVHKSRHGGAVGAPRHARMDGSRAGPSVLFLNNRGGGVFLWMIALWGKGLRLFFVAGLAACCFCGWCVGHKLLALLGAAYLFSVGCGFF